MNISNLQTGDVAKRIGITLRAIRYYEERGLIKPSAVTPSGLRLYSDRDVSRLRFIHRLRLLGLSLEDIKLALGVDKPDPATRKEILDRSLNALELTKIKIEEQMELLEQLQKENDLSLVAVKGCLGCSDGCSACPRVVHVL